MIPFRSLHIKNKWAIIGTHLPVLYTFILYIAINYIIDILLPFGVFFVALNYISLGFIQIHTVFYFNYIIYSGLLIFCCQNVAANTKDFILS